MPDPCFQHAPATPVSRLTRTLRLTRMLLHVAQGLIVTGLVYPRIAPRVRARITQAWANKLLRILNINLSVSGHRPDEDARQLFVVSNHVSWLDIFVINATQPSRFVAKSEIRDWPVAGWLCESAGTIFIRRAKRSDTTRINAQIHDVLAGGDTVAFFPEGTTTRGDQLLKFHTSLFEPAVANQAVIAPAAISYRLANGAPTQATNFSGQITFKQSIFSILTERNIVAEIIFAPGIATATLNRRTAAAAAEDAIAAMLNVPKSQTHQRFTDGPVVLVLQEESNG